MCDPCCPLPCFTPAPPSCFPMPSNCCPMPCDPCCPPKRCRSRELRSSVLITKCECPLRNGLQLDCPRSECHGRPMCATKPIPICCPAKYTLRYANVTMGKSSYGTVSKECCPRSDGTCNPCVVECGEPACYQC